MAENTTSPNASTTSNAKSTASAAKDTTTSAAKATTSAAKSTASKTTTAAKKTTTKATGTAAANRRKTAATKRSTTAKKAAGTRARNAAPKPSVTRRVVISRTPVEQVQDVAERVVLIPVGAALTARDKVVDTVSDIVDSYGSVDAARREIRSRQRDIETQLKRFERRGSSARTQLEREAKKTRTRVERELRQRRQRAEKVVTQNRRDIEKQFDGTRKDVTTRVELVSAQARNVAQTGVTAAEKALATVSERVASVA